MLSDVSILTRSKERVLRDPAGPILPEMYVSILTRSKERVLRTINFPFFEDKEFQSSPAPKSGCYGKFEPRVSCYSMFQSSPAPKSGCYDHGSMFTPKKYTFQSSPAPKSGCYPIWTAELFWMLHVSILTRSKERVLRRAGPAR